MIIIETCPKCGHDLQDLVLTTYPPIPQKTCFNCGWSWTGEREEIVRVPFGGNSINIEEQSYLNNFNFEDAWLNSSACDTCPNNIKNGGSGICHCILGQQEISY